MNTCIALFRGLNVGGKHLISMKQLSAVMEQAGAQEVRTYIQSGNAVFRGPRETGENAATLIEHQFGFRPEVWVLGVEALEQAAGKNPYRDVEGKYCHVGFCKGRPDASGSERLGQYLAAREAFVLDGEILYLHAPDGIGRSRLAANVERCLGVAVTARNLNTINRLLVLAKSPVE